VTHLRNLMLKELRRRNYAETSTRSYLHTVEDFSRRFHPPPDRLGPQHIREYQAELFQKRKASPATVAQRLAALRFFYTKTLQFGASPNHPITHSIPTAARGRLRPNGFIERAQSTSRNSTSSRKRAPDKALTFIRVRPAGTLP
jgi:integrase/recombinase XerD